MIAPNAVFDRLAGFALGEACATRDLVLDLYGALHRHGLKLLLYFTGDGPLGDSRAQAALGAPPASSLHANLQFINQPAYSRGVL